MGLEQFDNDAIPEQGFRPGIDCLVNGNYDFTVIDAELKDNPQSGDKILELGIRPDGGCAFTWAHFLNRQDNVNRLLAVLVTLGFDADRWHPKYGKRFSVELPNAIRWLPGRRFKGTKRSRDAKDGSGKVYHDLYVNARIPDQQQPAAAANGPAAAPPPAHAGQNDIPFPADYSAGESEIPF